jgi:hypothetical protein
VSVLVRLAAVAASVSLAVALALGGCGKAAAAVAHATAILVITHVFLQVVFWRGSSKSLAGRVTRVGALP